MENAFFYLMKHGFFTINMIPLILLFSWKLKKRSHYIARVVSGSILALTFTLLLTHGFFSYFIQIVVLTCFCFFICGIKFYEAMYCTILTYAVQHITHCFNQMVFRPGPDVPAYSPTYLICSVFFAILLYLLIGRKLPENGRYNINVRFSVISFTVLLILVLCLSIIADRIFTQTPNNLYYICMSYDLICCIFVLWEQTDYKAKLKYQQERTLEKQYWIRQNEIYRLRLGDVERINMLCHDLKKQLESLKLFATDKERMDYYNAVNQTIQSYDFQLDTGCKVLDILLAQKKILCLKNEIKLTCIVDGEKLNFIHAVDLYTILGNAIDNAVESVLPLSDPEKRVISVSAWTKGKLLIIQIENYFENENLKFKDGIPVTTKNANEGHGYGIRNIKKCVEKYHGNMRITTDHNMFQVTIIFPYLDTI